MNGKNSKVEEKLRYNVTATQNLEQQRRPHNCRDAGAVVSKSVVDTGKPVQIEIP